MLQKRQHLFRRNAAIFAHGREHHDARRKPASAQMGTFPDLKRQVPVCDCTGELLIGRISKLGTTLVLAAMGATQHQGGRHRCASPPTQVVAGLQGLQKRRQVTPLNVKAAAFRQQVKPVTVLRTTTLVNQVHPPSTGRKTIDP